MFLDEPPLRAPPGAVLLKVKPYRVDPQYPGLESKRRMPAVRARVLQVLQGRYKSRWAVLQPFAWMSCDRLGVVDQPAYVVGVVHVTKKRKMILIPMGYRPKKYRTPDEDQSIGRVVPKADFLEPEDR